MSATTFNVTVLGSVPDSASISIDGKERPMQKDGNLFSYKNYQKNAGVSYALLSYPSQVEYRCNLPVFEPGYAIYGYKVEIVSIRCLVVEERVSLDEF